MKRKLLIIFLIIVAVIVFFECKWYFKKIDSDKKINKFIIEKTGIPSNEILVVSQIKTIGNTGFFGGYEKVFTTKKDFEKWQERLKKEGKNYKDVEIKNCEIQYGCGYNPQTDKYSFDYILFGSSVSSFKKIEKNFAYPPTEFMKKFLKEEIPDFYKD